jgi:hypothetical protein
MFSSGVQKGDLHITLASLSKAAAGGCYICAPLLKRARREDKYLKTRLTGKCQYRFLITSDSDATLQLRMHTIETELAYLNSFYYETFVLIKGKLSPPVTPGIYDRRSTIPMAKAMQAAQKWMTTCLDKHEQCQKHTQPRTYPTRLLELEGHKVRLILPREDKPLGPYAALSYCWGTNPGFLRLTANNLQEFQLGIPCSSLPVAFQEAIQLLEELGIRYLWIDALCIIQSGFGSSEDWQSECGRMQDVYSNCVINLSLAQAAHPGQSCLRGYTFDSALPFAADILFTPPDHGLKETHTYTILYCDYFKEALYEQPIGSRAWVMQERLLATRILSIGHGELFWDCQQLPHASESLPCGFAPCGDSMRDTLSRKVELSIHSIPETPDSGDMEEIWSKILIEYTARKLTYPQADKLMAISAIATRMGAAMNDTYLVGHFRKTLPRSLNWWADRRSPARLRAKERVVQRLPKTLSQMLDGSWIVTPSWSWASMDGQLWYGYGPDMRFVAAMEAYKICPFSHKNPGARIENKLLLTIRTLCRNLEWKAVQPDINDSGLIKISTRNEDRNTFLEMDDIHDLPDDRSECLLALLGYRRSDNVLEGLLLRGINLDGNEVYERIGHFIRWFGNSDGSLRDLETYFPFGERLITLC